MRARDRVGPMRLVCADMALPPPPSLPAMVSEARLDPSAGVLLVVAAAAYFGAVRRLRGRGGQWPAARTVAFAAGLGALVVATQSGLARYDTVLFSAHVVQHLLLGMVGPFLLVLGAPVTLALRSSGRASRRWIVRVLRHPAIGALTHPVPAGAVFGGTLFVLYFTPLYGGSLRYGAVHAWVHVHFMVAGVLFCWAVVGVDRGAGGHHRLGHGSRLLLVVLTVPFHAVLGLALLQARVPLGDGWYEALHRSWGASPLSDQRLGGALLWAAGELFSVVAALVVLAQWLAEDEREARRVDARLDAQEAQAAAALVTPR